MTVAIVEGKYYIIPKVSECLSLRPYLLPPSPFPPASVPPPPWNQKGGATLAGGEGAGRANSDDWTESLALCLLCA